MRLSKSFFKTTKTLPAEETSLNAQLLIKAGFVHKTMAGVYAYLPLGLRVLEKIETTVRTRLNRIGAQEVLLNSLHPKQWWAQTGRWDEVDVLFKLKSQTEQEYGLAPTHEEQISPLMSQFITSYKDLPEYNPDTGQFPLAVYQIQTKFRDELRSKAGLMRGREFRMKDLYDFHRTKESQAAYFETMTKTYLQIFEEMGLEAYAVDASGGDFSDKFSREFQVVCAAGEDAIKFSPTTGFASNEEVYAEAVAKLETVPADIQTAKSAEVGNIFDLGDKWTKAFGITYQGEDNQPHHPTMGCHGIGTSRCLGVIAENYNDEAGLKWPVNVAPYRYHLVTHTSSKNQAEAAQILELAARIYAGEVSLNGHDLPTGEILWDDREGVGMGQKLKDADLIGCPYQLILSPRTLADAQLEWKVRGTGETFRVGLPR